MAKTQMTKLPVNKDTIAPLNSEHKVPLENNLVRLRRAERTTKEVLAQSSRMLLTYVVQTSDIAMVNRYLSACTPINREMCRLFFTEFLPWKYIKETKEFTTLRPGVKLWNKSLSDIAQFLSKEENNVWTWAEENTETKERQKNIQVGLKNNLEWAMKGHTSKKGTETPPIGAANIMKMVIEAGVPLNDIMSALEDHDSQVNTAHAMYGGDVADHAEGAVAH